jgi:beta-galactosidase
VSTELDAIGRRAVVDAVCAAAHVTAPISATAGVEVVVRRSADVVYVFAINHTHQEGSVDAEGTDLLTGQVHPAPVLIPAGGVVVLRRQR